MKMVYGLSLLLVFSASAHAEVTVEDRVLQKGIFVSTDDDCKPKNKKPISKECYCKADIHYPVISGMTDNVIQDKINNDALKRAINLQCNGAPADASVQFEDEDVATYKSSFKKTYHSNDLLALETEIFSYGYLSNGDPFSKSGIIIDLSTNTLTNPTPSALFGKNIPQVNAHIYKSLSKMQCPDLELTPKTQFLTKTECTNCSMSLDKDGIKIFFPQHTVGCGAMGSPEVLVPAKYVTAPIFKK